MKEQNSLKYKSIILFLFFKCLPYKFLQFWNGLEFQIFNYFNLYNTFYFQIILKSIKAHLYSKRIKIYRARNIFIKITPILPPILPPRFYIHLMYVHELALPLTRCSDFTLFHWKGFVMLVYSFQYHLDLTITCLSVLFLFFLLLYRL